METLTVVTDNKTNAEFLEQLLDKFAFVKSVTLQKSNKQKEMPKSKFTSDDDFMKLAGIWENRDITIEKIRDKA